MKNHRGVINAISARIYNLAAGWVGGLEVDIHLSG